MSSKGQFASRLGCIFHARRTNLCQSVRIGESTYIDRPISIGLQR
jgi:hypothetical protein